MVNVKWGLGIARERVNGSGTTCPMNVSHSKDSQLYMLHSISADIKSLVARKLSLGMATRAPSDERPKHIEHPLLHKSSRADD